MVPEFFQHLELHRNRAFALQIEEFIIDLIQKEVLKENFPLPSSRKLAFYLSVHRKTVIKAYDRLTAKGYVYTIERVGFYVNRSRPAPRGFKPYESKINLSEDYPDISLSPISELGRAYRRYFWKARNYDHHLVQSTGYPPFRDTMHTYLVHNRGINCTYEEFCVFYGYYTLLLMTVFSFLRKEGAIVMEEPADPNIRNVLRSMGLKFITVRVGHQGINTTELEAICQKHQIGALILSPRNQYPTTAVLSFGRREKVVWLSRKYGFTIIEKDFEHEFIYNKEVPGTLKGEFPNDNIIYISPLSKMIPSLHLTVLLIAPRHFIYSIRKLLYSQRNVILEQSLNELIREGVINLFSKKLNKIYKKRRDHIHQFLKRQSGIFHHPPQTGLAFWIEFSRPLAIEQVRNRLKKEGYYLQNPAHYFAGEHPNNAIRIGFGKSLPEHFEKIWGIFR